MNAREISEVTIAETPIRKLIFPGKGENELFLGESLIGAEKFYELLESKS